MKKFLLCLLLVTVCLACLVACGGDDTTTEITTTEKPVVTTPVATTDKGTDTPAPSGLEDAKAYLVALYKDESASTPVDYELIGALRVAGVAYTLEWSVGDVTGVTVTRKDAATVLIDVVDRVIVFLNVYKFHKHFCLQLRLFLARLYLFHHRI